MYGINMFDVSYLITFTMLLDTIHQVHYIKHKMVRFKMFVIVNDNFGLYERLTYLL